jgi:antitoxin (DNA-binding transcriptional repressor) of toxin-antitoxin stability system
MRAVGIRELKNHLSSYLRMVRSGEAIVVTDRGEVVAELRPPGEVPAPSKYPLLDEMARKGTLRLGGPNSPAFYPKMDPVLEPADIARLLDEERGDH